MTRDTALERLLTALKNDFALFIEQGSITVTGGCFTRPAPVVGWYYRIKGSAFSDGVYLYDGTPDDLPDETFDGEVLALGVPKAVRELADDIDAYITAHPDGEFVSESFGGYSYTRPTGSDGTPADWTRVFRRRMNPWRKA